MDLSPNACYMALCSHDARFDGRFYTAVSSTGIYCRPVCPVKTPKYENCTFYRTAAEAEAAGYRPCLRCRPELAPGQTPLEAGGRLAVRAAAFLEDPDHPDISLEDLAVRLGISSRHLRRIFQEAYGVTPAAYRITHRLLSAKMLLTDTRLPVTEVAMTAGFGSLRRFNALFRQQYGLNPMRFRNHLPAPGEEDKTFTVALGYRPPLDWDALLGFLESRTIEGVEKVQDGAYYRTVGLRVNDRFLTGWLKARPDADNCRLLLTGPAALAPALPHLIARIRRLFDLDCTPEMMAPVLSHANALLPDLYRPGVRLPGCFDPFEMAVRAVLGQQITVKAARTLAGRLATAYGTPVETPWPELRVLFPSAAKLTALPAPIGDRLGPLGVTGARSRTILALAEALSDGSLELSPLTDPAACRQKLMTLPGIGPWTAEYITMRALSWPDAFPHTDYGVRKALEGRTDAEILALAEPYRPWRAYLTLLLWQSLKP